LETTVTFGLLSFYYLLAATMVSVIYLADAAMTAHGL